MNNYLVFNSLGLPLSKDIEGMHDFILNMPRNSVGIPNIERLYVFEVVDGEIEKPELNSENTIKVTGEGYNLVSIDNVNELVKSKSLTFQRLREFSADAPISVDILSSHSSSGVKEGVLTMFGISLKVYTEIEEEEKRFSDLLNLQGFNLSSKEELIFKSSDINEPLNNARRLNEKRKELLTELREIKKYLPTTVGIERLVKFFEYEGIVEVKEFWLNKTSGLLEIMSLRDNPSRNLKKTNKFSIFYKEDYPSKENNEDGLPIVVDNFLISDEEVLIKLLSLRDYLNYNEVGGISNIIDVIGEYHRYYAYEIKHWKGENELTTRDLDLFVELDISTDNYVKKLRPNSVFTFQPNITNSEIASKTIFDLKDHLISWFEPKFTTTIEMLDQPDLLVGSTVSIRDKTFDIAFSAFTGSWDSNEINYTWGNVSSPYHYKTIVVITKNVEIDGRDFKLTLEGLPEDFKNFDVILPFDGVYSIELVHLGYDGENLSIKINNAIVVQKYTTEIVMFYKSYNPEIQYWKGNYESWDKLGESWSETITSNSGKISDSILPIDNLNYNDILRSGKEIVNVKWEDDITTWDQRKNFRWKDFEMNLETIPNVKLSFFSHGGEIWLNNFRMVIPEQIQESNFGGFTIWFNDNCPEGYKAYHRKTNFKNWIELYNHNETYKKDIISINSKNEILDMGNKSGIRTEVVKVISAVPSRSSALFVGSLIADPFTALQQTNLVLETNTLTKRLLQNYSWSKEEAYFGWDNIIYSKNGVEVPSGVPIFLTANNAIGGKMNVKWYFKDNFGNVLFTKYGITTGFIAPEPGLYTYEVEIEDNESNKYTIEKTNSIKVL